MSDPTGEAGMKVRREVLGDEHVERVAAAATPFTQPFQKTSSPATRGAECGRERASTGAPAAPSRSRCSPRSAVSTSSLSLSEPRCATGSARRRSPRCCCTPPSTPAPRRRTGHLRSPSASSMTSTSDAVGHRRESGGRRRNCILGVMTTRTTPPFRADHVGSLLRPPALLEAREPPRGRRDRRRRSCAAIEDDAIRDVVAPAGERRPAVGDRRRVPPRVVAHGLHLPARRRSARRRTSTLKVALPQRARATSSSRRRRCTSTGRIAPRADDLRRRTSASCRRRSPSGARRS